MYIHNCPQCGKQYSTEEKISLVKCPYCGAEVNVSYPDEPQQPAAEQQPGYQAQQPGYQGQQPGYQGQQPGYQGQQVNRGNAFDVGPSGKSRGIAGLLALLLGTLGIHYFYLNKTTPGLVFLLVSVLSCGILAAVTGIMSIIQGIMLLTGTEKDFEEKWVNPANTFPLF